MATRHQIQGERIWATEHYLVTHAARETGLVTVYDENFVQLAQEPGAQPILVQEVGEVLFVGERSGRIVSFANRAKLQRGEFQVENSPVSFITVSTGRDGVVEVYSGNIIVYCQQMIGADLGQAIELGELDSPVKMNKQTATTSYMLTEKGFVYRCGQRVLQKLEHSDGEPILGGICLGDNGFAFVCRDGMYSIKKEKVEQGFTAQAWLQLMVGETQIVEFEGTSLFRSLTFNYRLKDSRVTALQYGDLILLVQNGNVIAFNGLTGEAVGFQKVTTNRMVCFQGQIWVFTDALEPFCFQDVYSGPKLCTQVVEEGYGVQSVPTSKRIRPLLRLLKAGFETDVLVLQGLYEGKGRSSTSENLPLIHAGTGSDEDNQLGSFQVAPLALLCPRSLNCLKTCRPIIGVDILDAVETLIALLKNSDRIADPELRTETLNLAIQTSLTLFASAFAHKYPWIISDAPACGSLGLQIRREFRQQLSKIAPSKLIELATMGLRYWYSSQMQRTPAAVEAVLATHYMLRTWNASMAAMQEFPDDYEYQLTQDYANRSTKEPELKLSNTLVYGFIQSTVQMTTKMEQLIQEEFYQLTQYYNSALASQLMVMYETILNVKCDTPVSLFSMLYDCIEDTTPQLQPYMEPRNSESALALVLDTMRLQAPAAGLQIQTGQFCTAYVQECVGQFKTSLSTTIQETLQQYDQLWQGFVQQNEVQIKEQLLRYMQEARELPPFKESSLGASQMQDTSPLSVSFSQLESDDESMSARALESGVIKTAWRQMQSQFSNKFLEKIDVEFQSLKDHEDGSDLTKLTASLDPRQVLVNLLHSVPHESQPQLKQAITMLVSPGAARLLLTDSHPTYQAALRARKYVLQGIAQRRSIADAVYNAAQLLARESTDDQKPAETVVFLLGLSSINLFSYASISKLLKGLPVEAQRQTAGIHRLLDAAVSLHWLFAI